MHRKRVIVLNWLSVLAAAVLLCSIFAAQAIAGHVTMTKPSPQQAGTQPSWENDPALKVLNLWYIRIATAEVKNDKKALALYAQKMQTFALSKDKPYLHLPALRARTFILSRLDDRQSFVDSFEALCRIGKVGAEKQAKVIKFANALLPWLKSHKKSAWAGEAEQAGLSAAGPDPNDLYMFLLKRRLNELKDRKSRIQLLREGIQNTDLAIIRLKKAEPKSPATPDSAIPASQPSHRTVQITDDLAKLKDLRAMLAKVIHGH